MALLNPVLLVVSAILPAEVENGAYGKLVFPPAFVEILVEKWLFYEFFRNNFSTSGSILNLFSGTPSGCKYASFDI